MQGGILLVAVAIRMLNPTQSGYSPEGSQDIAIVPLAFPLTAGLGAIKTVILLVSKANSFYESPFVFVGIFVGVLISYVGMFYSSRLFKLLGDEGLRVVTALMAIMFWQLPYSL